MNKKKLTITIIAIILLITATFIILKTRTTIPTGQTILYTHKYTKAICNETNFCQDYEITCSGNQTLSIIPIPNTTLQLPPEWKDPRTKENIETMC